MPKLDGTHIVERLRERLEDLQSGKEVAARDLRALLSTEQLSAMDAAWAEQQSLRKKKRARTKEEEIALGWKTKREIHIAAYERAVNEATNDEPGAWEQRAHDAELRQARIYFNTLGKELDAHKDMQTARNAANNALTRAALSRLDGGRVGHQSRRDKEVWEMEQQILQRARSEMSPEELEQLELLNEHEKALLVKVKKLGR